METAKKIKMQVHPNDRYIWTFIASVLERLGPLGMSSDETERDESRARALSYRVHFVPWRNPNFVDIADELDMLQAEKSRTTRVRGPRVQQAWMSNEPSTGTGSSESSGVPESTRRPVQNLPRIFYNEDWLAQFAEEHLDQIISVSKEQFIWLKLAARDCHTGNR